MLKSTKKNGRPQTEYRTSWGDIIQGFTRLADKRWKVSGPPVIKFTEADEFLAVGRFRELQAQQQGWSNDVAIPTATSTGVDGKITGVLPPTVRDLARLRGTYLPRSVMTAKPATVGGPPVAPGKSPVNFTNHVKLDGEVVRFHDQAINADLLFVWFRELILERPKWLAERVGIEQIGYLTDILPPKPSPTLQELVDLYVAKPDLSSAEVTRSKLFWTEFCRAVGTATVREIDHEAVVRYETKVLAGGYSPKYIHHRYGKIRTILLYAIKRGCGIDDCRHALDCTALLEVKNHTPLDPKPITPKQFWAIHAEAVEAGDETFATLMLTALNTAMYGGEVSALKWDEVNVETGEVVTRRPKTSVSRVAILWPEVLTGLRKLARQGDYIFYSTNRSYYSNAVVKAWKKYRTAAELGNDVKFGQLRDAAFTIANNVSLDQARVLAGHRIGMADHYIRRNPQFVAPACQAIHDAFYATKKSTKH